MHVLPQLRKLEQQFGSAIAIVGVQSGKFTAERDVGNIRDASIRLNAVHPTVNDRQFRVWRSYAVNAWPTLVAIDPRGYVVGTRAGEWLVADIAAFLEGVIGTARANGSLKESPLHFAADAPTMTPGTLAYPGKIAVDGDRIAIADSGHHRVLVGSLDTGRRVMRVSHTYGGDAGYRDGPDAQFNNPQGVVFDGDVLHVADAGNHSVRSISLTEHLTRTLAGTGYQARTTADLDAGALSSPWDLALHGRDLFVAMAGLHQIWRVNIESGASSVHSGSGAEELHDGSHAEAALAQPMGLCVANDAVFSCDSESSAIRESDVAQPGSVRTIVGTGLFDFGDVDGSGDDVRLQHPQAIVLADDGRLLVADSYNGALKWIQRAERRVTTFVRELHEPSGLALANGRVYVAEPNAHRISIITLDTGERSILEIEE